MREVEVSLRRGKLADVLGELRKWLDHHNCVPESFDIAKGKRGALLVRMRFAEDDIAETFQGISARLRAIRPGWTCRRLS